MGEGICVLIKMHRAVPIGIDDRREVLRKPGLSFISQLLNTNATPRSAL